MIPSGVAPLYPNGEFRLPAGLRLALCVEVTAFALTDIAKEIHSDLLPLVRGQLPSVGPHNSKGRLSGWGFEQHRGDLGTQVPWAEWESRTLRMKCSCLQWDLSSKVTEALSEIPGCILASGQLRQLPVKSPLCP